MSEQLSKSFSNLQVMFTFAADLISTTDILTKKVGSLPPGPPKKEKERIQVQMELPNPYYGWP